MRTVYHPTLNVSREVPEDSVEEWRESGWRLTKPRAKDQSPAAATASDQGQHSDEGNEGA
jgi:hypothetical protein